MVELQTASSAIATFALTEELHNIRLSFELTVTDSSGTSSSRSISYAWKIAGADAGGAITAPDARITGPSNAVSGAAVELDGNMSVNLNGQIISWYWQQISGTHTVTLSADDAASIEFTAPFAIEEAAYKFQLTVTDDNGETGTDQFTVNVSPLVVCPVCATGGNAAELKFGNRIKAEKLGSFTAIAGGTAYVANQDSSLIMEFDLASGQITNAYDMNAVPTEIEYLPAENSLYVAQADASEIARINLDTQLVDFIPTSGEALSMSSSASGVYYTVAKPGLGFEVFSVDSNLTPVSHGIVDADFISYNANRDELIAVRTGLSPASVYRFGFDASRNLVEQQKTTGLGGNARSTSVSGDGQHLAVAAGSGNGAGYTIHDLDPADFSMAGEWDTKPYPRWVEFTAASDFVLASNDEELIIFDTSSHIEKLRMTLPACTASYEALEQVGISADDEYVFVKQVCGFDRDQTQLYYFKLPQFTP